MCLGEAYITVASTVECAFSHAMEESVETAEVVQTMIAEVGSEEAASSGSCGP